MRIALILLVTISTLSADIVVETQEWQPACDGSIIEVAKDHGSIKGIRASASHNAVIVEWTVHFFGGKPISAEYRESKREKYAHGERAGEFTGKITLKTIKTWISEKGRFQIGDKSLAGELHEILALAEKKTEQGAAANP